MNITEREYTAACCGACAHDSVNPGGTAHIARQARAAPWADRAAAAGRACGISRCSMGRRPGVTGSAGSLNSLIVRAMVIRGCAAALDPSRAALHVALWMHIQDKHMRV